MHKTILKAVRLCIIAITIFAISGCKTKMSSDELLEHCGSGVVLILNQYYYKVTLPQCKPWYFTAIDSDGEMQGITFDKEEAAKNPAMLTGTGFLISTDGKIITNRHVAAPAVDFDDAKLSVSNVLKSIRMLIEQELNQYSYQYDQLEIEKNECYTSDFDGNMYVDENKMQQINDKEQELHELFEQGKEMIGQISSVDVSKVKVESVCKVSVAYNNSVVKGFSDFKPCSVNAVSAKQDVDLALLQLKDKKTPGNAFVFDISDSEDDKNMETSEPLYMIGYNAGFAIASTAQGIKAQITRGEISQKSDSNKILYTIPALPGSSGSPVINSYGTLVAVNFAGMQNTQSFNYGIRMSRVKQFVEEHK